MWILVVSLWAGIVTDMPQPAHGILTDGGEFYIDAPETPIEDEYAEPILAYWEAGAARGAICRWH